MGARGYYIDYIVQAKNYEYIHQNTVFFHENDDYLKGQPPFSRADGVDASVLASASDRSCPTEHA